MVRRFDAKIYPEPFAIWVLQNGIKYIERSNMWELKDGSKVFYEDLEYQFRKHLQIEREKQKQTA